jgi:hypothetical protein
MTGGESAIRYEAGSEAVPFARHVALQVSDDGPEAARGLRRRVHAVLTEQPRALLCDLSPLASPLSADLVEVVDSVARHQHDWPGTPTGVVTTDQALRQHLDKQTEDLERFVVGSTRHEVHEALAAIPAADHATMTLEPGLRAPRSARAFVARACLGWQTHSVIGHACLVTSELVTNAVLHAATVVHLTVSRCPGKLRIAVRDGDETRPSTRFTAAADKALTGSGRGLLLVSSVCPAWGVYPTADDGKEVWAVLDAECPAEREPGTSRR